MIEDAAVRVVGAHLAQVGPAGNLASAYPHETLWPARGRVLMPGLVNTHAHLARHLARGLSLRRIRAKHVALVASFFGGFQALMPLFGWLLGSHVGKAVAAWDHWIILLVLGGIGGKMLWEAFHHEQAQPQAEADAFRLRVML